MRSLRLSEIQLLERAGVSEDHAKALRVSFARIGNFTLAIVYDPRHRGHVLDPGDNGPLRRIGVAKRNPIDPCRPDHGYRLALLRAMRRHVPIDVEPGDREFAPFPEDGVTIGLLKEAAS